MLMKNKVLNEIRRLIIENFNAGKTKKSISMFLGLPMSTIGSIIKVYLDSGRTTKICAGGQ